MSQRNICIKQKQTHRHRDQTCGCLGEMVGEMDGLEFGISRCKLLYVEWINKKSYCIAQGPIFNILFSSVQFSRRAMSNSLRPHGLQHARLPCPSPTPRVCSNSCPSSQRCQPTISSSVIPFSFCLRSFPTSGSFPKSQFFTSGGQSIGVLASASVLLMNIQD